MTNATGTVLWSWNSDAFGTTLADQDVDGDGTDFEFNLRFPGQYFDKESGQHYNYFRDYEPGTGRYLESDPIGLDGGVNTFLYVGGNPLIYIDELGLNCKYGGICPRPQQRPPLPFDEIDIQCYLKCRNKKGANMVCPFIAAGFAGICGAGVTVSRTGLVTRSLSGNCAKGGFGLCNTIYHNICGKECKKCTK